MNYEYSTAAYTSIHSIILISLAISILLIVCLCKIYDKAGEPGWKCLIPWYNNYILFKFIYGNGWKFLLLLIPFVNIVIYIKISFDLANVFGKSIGFGFLLWFLPVIGYPLLAFGDAEYTGAKST